MLIVELVFYVDMDHQSPVFAAKNGEQQLIHRPCKTADIFCKPPKISFTPSMRFPIDILECQEDNPLHCAQCNVIWNTD